MDGEFPGDRSRWSSGRSDGGLGTSAESLFLTGGHRAAGSCAHNVFFRYATHAKRASWRPASFANRSPVAHHRRRRFIPIEVRPHIRATMAAGATDETRFNVGQPEIIGPAVTVDGNRMAATVISAIDQQPTDALGTHVSEGDFLRADWLGHSRP